MSVAKIGELRFYPAGKQQIHKKQLFVVPEFFQRQGHFHLMISSVAKKSGSSIKK